jgi:hypothetical protein
MKLQGLCHDQSADEEEHLPAAEYLGAIGWFTAAVYYGRLRTTLGPFMDQCLIVWMVFSNDMATSKQW